MKTKLLITFLFLVSIGALSSFSAYLKGNKESVIPSGLVLSYLNSLGEPLPFYFVEKLDTNKIKQGEDLITIGYTRKDRMNTPRISKHFVCINCHNVVPENQDLANTDLEIRFDYMMKNKLPFLPAPSLYGVVNRTNYFNGDYEKKYGALAINAQDSLTNAIQLCSETISQGRKLNPWELDAIVHYLNSIQLKIEDLSVSEMEWKEFETKDNKSKVEFIESKYMQNEKSTFGFPQTPSIRKYGSKGDWKKGEYIFKSGCMHCHHSEGITVFTLEDDQFNRNFLKERMDKTNNRSIYEITRLGTQPKKLKKSYMPLFTYEKLTEMQLEHLAAYLNYNPNKK